MEELRLMLLWSNLFGLRLLLTIMPQYGYLTSDEFSESPQQMAGILGLDSELNEKAPKMDILFPLLTSGIPFSALSIINDYGPFGRIISPYTVLVAPRLWMTFCSMLADVFIYKTAINIGCNRKAGLSAMVLFGGCYVTLVMFTRTLPTATSAILLALLLYVITICAIGNQLISTNYVKNAMLAGCLFVLGTHFDTTFFNYSIFPILLWLIYPQFSLKRSLIKLFLLLIAVVLSSCSICLLNSVYITSEITANSVRNLRTYHCVSQTLHLDAIPKVVKLKNLVAQFILIFSSLFLIIGPLITPLSASIKTILLSCAKYADALLLGSIFGTFSIWMLFEGFNEISISPLVVPMILLIVKHQRISKQFVLCFGVFNFFAFMYAGVYSYGGAVHSMDFFGSTVQTMRHFRITDVVFYRTPALPKYLMAMQCDYDAISGECTQSNYLDLRLTEVTPNILKDTLDALLSDDRMVFLVIPGSLPCTHISQLNTLYNLQLFYRCFPHIISTGILPDYTNPHEWCSMKGGYFSFITELIHEKFSLNAYGVSRPRPAKTKPIEKAEKLTVLLDDYSSSM